MVSMPIASSKQWLGHTIGSEASVPSSKDAEDLRSLFTSVSSSLKCDGKSKIAFKHS